MVLIIITTITIKMRTGIRMTECDNFQPCKYHVGTRNSCYLRTYILLVPHDLSKPKVFKTAIYVCMCNSDISWYET
jgi:hypothetical protein